MRAFMKSHRFAIVLVRLAYFVRIFRWLEYTAVHEGHYFLLTSQ